MNVVEAVKLVTERLEAKNLDTESPRLGNLVAESGDSWLGRICRSGQHWRRWTQLDRVARTLKGTREKERRTAHRERVCLAPDGKHGLREVRRKIRRDGHGALDDTVRTRMGPGERVRLLVALLDLHRLRRLDEIDLFHDFVDRGLLVGGDDLDAVEPLSPGSTATWETHVSHFR